MRLRLISISALFFFATAVFAKDVYLSIGGSVGVFRADMRIFNPSSTKDIEVQATLLPVGNIDNSSRQSTTIMVPKRQMLDYDDVVTSLFNSSGLAAIRLSSSDDFVATERIYAQQGATSCNDNPGTLGQFVPGLDISAAKKQGVLIQLKKSDKYRTNIGAVNPNATAANVTWRLYDKNNALVGSVKTITYAPFGVQGPTSLTSFADNVPGNADFSDAWASFVSDQPILAYASVIDNATTDPTFIPMSEDTGVPPTQSGATTFNVTLQNFSITISPAPSTLKVGDQVIFHITVLESNHGFELDGPNGSAVIAGAIFSPGMIVDKTFTVPSQGTYNYFCTNSGCGAHTGMSGSFNVGNPTYDPGGPHY